MSEIFSNWEWWQIALTAVFGTLWLVCFILDCRRKSRLKRFLAEKRQELKTQGYTDEMIDEIIQHRTKELFKDDLKKADDKIKLFEGKQGSGKALHSFKDGEK